MDISTNLRFIFWDEILSKLDYKIQETSKTHILFSISYSGKPKCYLLYRDIELEGLINIISIDDFQSMTRFEFICQNMTDFNSTTVSEFIDQFQLSNRSDLIPFTAPSTKSKVLLNYFHPNQYVSSEIFDPLVNYMSAQFGFKNIFLNKDKSKVVFPLYENNIVSNQLYIDSHYQLSYLNFNSNVSLTLNKGENNQQVCLLSNPLLVPDHHNSSNKSSTYILVHYNSSTRIIESVIHKHLPSPITPICFITSESRNPNDHLLLINLCSFFININSSTLQLYFTESTADHYIFYFRSRTMSQIEGLSILEGINMRLQKATEYNVSPKKGEQPTSQIQENIKVINSINGDVCHSRITNQKGNRDFVYHLSVPNYTTALKHFFTTMIELSEIPHNISFDIVK